MLVTIFRPAVWDEHKSAYKHDISVEFSSPLPCNSNYLVLEFFGIYSHLSQCDGSKVENLELKKTDPSPPSGAIDQH